MLRTSLLAAALLAALPAAAQEVTVSFRDTPMREVAATFARLSGTSIVLAPGAAAGEVTAEIRAQPWEAALRAIAGAHGLAVREVAPGVLRVEPAAAGPVAEAQGSLATRVFRLRYLPAEEAARTLEGMLSPRGRMAASEHSNALVVTDTPDRVAEVARILGHPPE